MENLLKPEKTSGRAIDEATIRERILKNSVPVTTWVTACLLRDGTVNLPIGELYGHYEYYCREENCLPLPRKVWIGAMKLAGFKTQRGAFAGLALRRGGEDSITTGEPPSGIPLAASFAPGLRNLGIQLPDSRTPHIPR